MINLLKILGMFIIGLTAKITFGLPIQIIKMIKYFRYQIFNFIFCTICAITMYCAFISSGKQPNMMRILALYWIWMVITDFIITKIIFKEE